MHKGDIDMDIFALSRGTCCYVRMFERLQAGMHVSVHMQECLYAEMQCDVRYGCWAAINTSVVFQAYAYVLIRIMNVAA